MGIFKRKTSSRLGADVEEVILGLEEAVRVLQDRQVALEHIEVEWADWFEKFKNLYARLNKRVEREEAKEEPPEDVPISPQAQRIFNSRGM